MLAVPQLQKITLEVVLEFAADADLSRVDVAESVTEAIYAHDDSHRLLGYAPKSGESLLLGTSVGVAKRERVRDPLEELWSRLDQQPPEEIEGERQAWEKQHGASSREHTALTASIDQHVREALSRRRQVDQTYTNLILAKAGIRAPAKKAFDAATKSVRAFLKRHKIDVAVPE